MSIRIFERVTDTPPVPGEREPPGAVGKVHLAVLLAGVGLSLVAFVACFMADGTANEFAMAGLEVFPLALLASLAYLGLRRDWARVLSGILAGLLLAGFLLILLFLLLMLQEIEAAGPDTAKWGFMGMAAVISASALVFGRHLRPWLARAIPIDPGDFVHTMALFLVFSISGMNLVPLVAAGTPPVLELVIHDPMQSYITESDLLGMVYGCVWLVLLSFIAAGYGIRRGFACVMARLGLFRQTGRQLGLAFLMGVVLVGVFGVLGWGIDCIWTVFGWPTTDETAIELLFRSVAAPIGALVIGVTAGIGEELVVRGLLQPRLGLVLSNVFFTSLHASQYHWDGLLQVFLLGLVLGLVRKRTGSVVPCMIVHGVYNIVILILLF